MVKQSEIFDVSLGSKWQCGTFDCVLREVWLMIVTHDGSSIALKFQIILAAWNTEEGKIFSFRIFWLKYNTQHFYIIPYAQKYVEWT